MQAGIEGAVGLPQHRVARDGVQPIMDGAVDAVIRRQVVLGVRRLHFRLQRAEIGDVVVGHPGHGEFARQAFESGHHLKAVTHVVGRQRHDLGAAIGELHQKSVGRQHAERLAQRRARNAQPFAKLPLVQLGAGSQLALDDQGAQPFGHCLRQRRSSDRKRRTVHVSGHSLA